MTTKLVGILNITPDSFSDGGQFDQETSALAHLAQMLNEGADVIDVGAESTRPNATAISDVREWQRLEKILPKIIEQTQKFNHDNNKSTQISIDTYHAATARKSWAQGVNIINDVSGLQSDEMIEFIAQNNCPTIFMHSLSVPANPDIIINKALNVTDEIITWAEKKIAYLEKKGIKKSQLIFDPGLGFSKNAEQSLRIVKNISAFKKIGLPIYVGHSKKSFLDALHIDGLSNDKQSRPQKTLIISNYLARQNIDYIRIHNVAQNKAALKDEITSNKKCQLSD